MIRILIAEDMRTTYILLKAIFDQQPNFEVVGWAMNGREAVQKAEQLKPDLITMDVQMPEMNGLEATREIMSRFPVPIVIVSMLANGQDNNLTFSALEEGAMAVCPKPAGPGDPEFDMMNRALINTIKSMADVRLRKPRVFTPEAHQHPTQTIKNDTNIELLAIGCSAGGPQALHTILADIPESFPVPIVVVQHMVEGFMEGMAAWLNKEVSIPVKIVQNCQKLEAGVVYLGADSNQFLVDRSNGELISHLVDRDPVDGFKPAVTVLFESVARVCGKNAIGGILSGMGKDGAPGLLAMHNAGADTFVQDEATSLVHGMPSAALSLGATRNILPVNQIVSHINNKLV